MTLHRETDYVTVKPAVPHGKFNAVVMRWNGEEHVVFRISTMMQYQAACITAQAWANESRLDVR